MSSRFHLVKNDALSSLSTLLFSFFFLALGSVIISFTHLCCLSANHPDRSPSAGCPGRRPGKTGWVRPGCPWWPAYRPSVPSSRPVSISPSARRTCPGSPRRPTRRERSCSPAPGTLLQETRTKKRGWSDSGWQYRATQQTGQVLFWLISCYQTLFLAEKWSALHVTQCIHLKLIWQHSFLCF